MALSQHPYYTDSYSQYWELHSWLCDFKVHQPSDKDNNSNCNEWLSYNVSWQWSHHGKLKMYVHVKYILILIF